MNNRCHTFYQYIWHTKKKIITMSNPTKFNRKVLTIDVRLQRPAEVDKTMMMMLIKNTAKYMIPHNSLSTIINNLEKMELIKAATTNKCESWSPIIKEQVKIFCRQARSEEILSKQWLTCISLKLSLWLRELVKVTGPQVLLHSCCTLPTTPTHTHTHTNSPNFGCFFVTTTFCNIFFRYYVETALYISA